MRQAIRQALLTIPKIVLTHEGGFISGRRESLSPRRSANRQRRGAKNEKSGRHDSCLPKRADQLKVGHDLDQAHGRSAYNEKKEVYKESRQLLQRDLVRHDTVLGHHSYELCPPGHA